ncbi:hypothetical protein [Achromobacter arsenitoxydans]|nr:hypothetical protein [Achromobacter arsenitoxydans]
MMQAQTVLPEAARRDDATRTADRGYLAREDRVKRIPLNDADILSVLFDLFAGRTSAAFGETLEWWNETLQCDLGPRATAGVALSALSKWTFDQRAGTDGVAALRAQLLQRAHMLITRSASHNGEAA